MYLFWSCEKSACSHLGIFVSANPQCIYSGQCLNDLYYGEKSKLSLNRQNMQTESVLDSQKRGEHLKLIRYKRHEYNIR